MRVDTDRFSRNHSLVPTEQIFFCIFFEQIHFPEVVTPLYLRIPNLFRTKRITHVNQHKSTTQSRGIHPASVFVRLLPAQSNPK